MANSPFGEQPSGGGSVAKPKIWAVSKPIVMRTPHCEDDVASRFTAAASALTQALTDFEAKLLKRSSLLRVEVDFYSDLGSHYVALQRNTVGDGWSLWVWDHPAEDGREGPDGDTITGVNGKPLLRAPVTVKIAAANVLPNLLDKLEKQQAQQVAHALEATKLVQSLMSRLEGA